MDKIKLFEDFLNEVEGTHSYGCVMVYFYIKNWELLFQNINPDDILEKENEPHVTLLYGLHNNINPDDVIKIIKGFPAIAIELTEISLFENEKDVLKFTVKNPMLENLFEELSKLPNSNAYPEYKPHMTICYCKKGRGSKYIKQIEPITLTMSHFVYSLANGEKIEIPI